MDRGGRNSWGSADPRLCQEVARTYCQRGRRHRCLSEQAEKTATKLVMWSNLTENITNQLPLRRWLWPNRPYSVQVGCVLLCPTPRKKQNHCGLFTTYLQTHRHNNKISWDVLNGQKEKPVLLVLRHLLRRRCHLISCLLESKSEELFRVSFRKSWDVLNGQKEKPVLLILRHLLRRRCHWISCLFGSKYEELCRLGLLNRHCNVFFKLSLNMTLYLSSRRDEPLALFANGICDTS